MSGLSLSGVSKRFGDRVVLDGLDLDVDDGEIVSVLGRSGGGKTTLLRVIAGLATPDSGAVSIGGDDVTGRRPGARSIGMVFQQPALLPHLSVAENVGFAEARGRRSRPSPDVLRAAEATGCDELLDRVPDTLSGGERQRVALARALVRSPRVMLLDEPLAGLDVAERSAVRIAVRRALVDAGLTALHVTHDQSEAFAMGHRVAVVDDGRVAQIGTADELLDAPSSMGVARLVATPRIAFLGVEIDGAGMRAGPFRLDGATSAAAAVEVIAGIRADDLRFVGEHDGEQVAGIVVACDVHDDTAIAHVEVGGATVPVLVDRASRPAVGARRSLAPSVSRWLLFDAESGRRVGRS